MLGHHSFLFIGNECNLEIAYLYLPVVMDTLECLFLPLWKFTFYFSYVVIFIVKLLSNLIEYLSEQEW